MKFDGPHAGVGAVQAFLDVAGRSLERFRYFNNRVVSERLKGHLFTVVVTDHAKPVAYGHLDADGERVWLGACVAEGRTGVGIGALVVQYLVALADCEGSELTLSVDADNNVAKCLYEKFGFVFWKQHSESVALMKRRCRVADTLGSLIDKLATTNQKMFVNQELLYEIRRMSFDEYKARYFADENGAKLLWETLKKACDLNVQRSALVSEVDTKIIEMIRAALAGKDLDDGAFLQRPHKTY